MPDRVGQVLDLYRLLNLVGIGTFGEVYLAEHVNAHNRVAIKTLQVHPTPEELKFFLQEARMGMVHLKHPHIVPLLDFGIENDIPFLVMEYAPNGTLRQLHPQGSPVPLELVASYIHQMAGALQYAHDRRLVHRDVKPQNMLLGERGEVLLSDFGIATIAHSERSLVTQEMAGSASYIAPEQVRGKPLPASDQYALAICAYEWLTGSLPFRGTPWEVLQQHIHKPPDPLHDYAPTLPPGVEEVVMKALAKNPNERFASVQAFADAFEQACHNAGLTTVSSYIPVLRGSEATSLALPGPDNMEQFEPTLQIRGSKSGVAPPFVTTPVSSWAGRRRLLTGRGALLIGAAMLLVASIILLYPPLIGPYFQSLARTNALNATATARSLAQANARLAAQQYARAVEKKGIMFGFDAAHSRSNPYEVTLSKGNLPGKKPLWTYTTDNVVGSSPVVADGVVYIGSADHNFYAFDVACGPDCKPKWQFTTGGVIDASPAVAGHMVYVGSADHKLYAFDATCHQDCQPLWTYLTGDVIDSSPTVANGIVYIGSQDNTFYAFDTTCHKDCRPLWHFITHDGIASSPAVAGGKIFVGSGDGNLYVFDESCRKDPCEPLWTAQIGDSTFSSPLVVGDKVYVGSADGTLSVFDARCSQSCSALWTRQLGSAIITSPAAAGGLLYIGTAEGRIDAFELACQRNCAPRWSYLVGETNFSSPTMANGLLYISGENHTLSIFEAHCPTNVCQPLWTSVDTSVPGRLPSTTIVSTFMNSSPMVVDGIVYVGSPDGRVLAFGGAS